jgi:hypothetical protein
MVRRLGMVVMFGGVLATASAARAFSMGDVTATTGMQGTLAKSGSLKPASTIASVKSAVGAAAATKQGQLDGAAGAAPIGWGGKGGGPGGWAKAGGGGGNSGWAGATGWATASNSWATGAGSTAWATGGWK